MTGLTIEQSIASNPAVVVALLGLFITMMGGLLVVLYKLASYLLTQAITKPYEQLTLSIDKLTAVVVKMQQEKVTERNEIRSERMEDLKELGLMKDRQQKQETICSTHRELCTLCHPEG